MLTGKIGVTTARNATGSAAAAQARAWAEQLGAIYVERPHNMGVDELMAQYDLAALVVGEKDGPRIHSAAGSFAYHPGMAVLRLQQLKRGATEHLLTALDLRPGKRVLDATLGLAADAAISSYIVGDEGTVVGLEASPLLHFAVSYGLQHYVAEDADLTAALRRIQPAQAWRRIIWRSVRRIALKLFISIRCSAILSTVPRAWKHCVRFPTRKRCRQKRCSWRLKQRRAWLSRSAANIFCASMAARNLSAANTAGLSTE